MQYKTHWIKDQGTVHNPHLHGVEIFLVKRYTAPYPGDVQYDAKQRRELYAETRQYADGCSYGDCADYGRGTG